MQKWINRQSLHMDRYKFRLPMYMAMLVDRTSDYYMVSKSVLIRNLIDNSKGLDELHNFYRMPDSLAFFNKAQQVVFRLDDEDIQFLEDLRVHLGISRDRTLETVILSGIDKITRIMNKSKTTLPDARKRYEKRFCYVNAEIHDAFCQMRDERGESISLLLKEAVSGYRKRTADPIHRFSKEKNLTLRLLPQDWERVDMVAISSDMDVAEVVASIMVDYYEIKRDYGESD